MVETREFFDAFSANQHKDDQGKAPSRAIDPGWAHGIMVNGGRQKIKCKYCHKIILGGGISRLKQHLAGERGNVAPCEEVPEDVKVQIQQHLGFKVLQKLKRQKGIYSGKNSRSSHHQDREGEADDVQRSPKAVSTRAIIRKRTGKVIDEGTSYKRKRPKKQLFPAAQASIHSSFASQESMDQADMAVARFIYEAGIPFSAANSCYFQQMADAIAAVGPGYKMPSYQSLRGKLLNRSVQDVGGLCQELRRSWEVTGCSVMVDNCTDRTGHTVLNFYVYCPKGTIFLRSASASEIENSTEALLSLFVTVVEEVGPKNIVNFITDTKPTFKAAGKLVMDRYKSFFWSACGAHCIDLMLEEIGKREEVEELLAKAKRITQFIYNNTWVLNLMRKKTGGRDIVQIATTRFASNFLTLQRFVSFKDALHRMFTSVTWMQSTFSKQRAGVEVAEIMVDPTFWSLCDRAVKVSKPLLAVLHLIDCEERPSIGYIYDAMEKARKSIILALDNEESDYLPYLKIIDCIWKEEFHSPLHAAACYLNPSVFYNPSFSTNKVIQKGLLDCIESLEPNLSTQVMITSHINYYEEAVGDFSRPVALRGRESLTPATWWSLYAADYPDLQRLAIRVLSQTCSINRCDTSWSISERFHSKQRNRLEHQRLNDLIFVHYNLRLKEKRSESSKGRCMRDTYDPTCSEAIDAGMEDWVEEIAIERGDNDITGPSERSSVEC